jgi:hypothetical protein
MVLPEIGVLMLMAMAIADEVSEAVPDITSLLNQVVVVKAPGL